MEQISPGIVRDTALVVRLMHDDKVEELCDVLDAHENLPTLALSLVQLVISAMSVVNAISGVTVAEQVTEFAEVANATTPDDIGYDGPDV